jgi:hypothetical protein
LRFPINQGPEALGGKDHVVHFDTLAFLGPVDMGYLPGLENSDDCLGDLAHTPMLLAGGKKAFPYQTRFVGGAP